MSSTRQQEISTTQTTESAKKEPVGVTLEGLMAMAKSMLAHKEKKESSAKDEKAFAEEKEAFLKSSGWVALEWGKKAIQEKMKEIEEANPQYFKKAKKEKKEKKEKKANVVSKKEIRENLTGEKSYYGMHDAPGGNQNPNSFMNGSTPISIGDEKQFRLPWSFINPTIESKLLEQGFIDENGYKKNIDIKKIREILIEYREEIEITESPEYLEKNIDYLIESPQRLRQAYMSLTTKKGDLIYIRGKTSFLEEGWLFEIQDSKQINYIQQVHLYGSSLISTKTFKAIKKIPDEVYRSICGRRASVWKLNETEITQLLK
uniref:Uncharacterized protein n=1 Tax=viral metagenome TaxID=1070528 RepID=A0A6C0J5T4_9ZZZZ